MKYFISYTFTAHGNTRIASGIFDLVDPITDNNSLQDARKEVIRSGGSAQVGKDEGRCESIVCFSQIA